MKKFMNIVDNMVHESLLGFASAYPDLISVHFEPTLVTRKAQADSKVVLISGGGSGHEPLHVGFVGRGMLDAACPGQIFTSPTPDQMLAAVNTVENGKGVLFLVKNYSGDLMNFEMAAEMIESQSETVLISDDVALKNSSHTTGRRGVAGTLIVEKIVGAAAEEGADLYECKRLGDRVNTHTGSMGVAFTSCTVPALRQPTFQIGPDEIEMGVGIHGEPGRRRERFKLADSIVKDLLDMILTDLNPTSGSEVLLHVNGFGGTPLMELYLLYQSAATRLKEANLNVMRSLVGNYTTCLEMAGASLTVCVLDDQIKRLWDAPVHTPMLRWG
jgi:dihydroxyacetone kinase-like protein